MIQPPRGMRKSATLAPDLLRLTGDTNTSAKHRAARAQARATANLTQYFACWVAQLFYVKALCCVRSSSQDARRDRPRARQRRNLQKDFSALQTASFDFRALPPPQAPAAERPGPSGSAAEARSRNHAARTG